MSSHFKLSTHQDSKLVDPDGYSGLVRKLIYFIISRPNIIFVA